MNRRRWAWLALGCLVFLCLALAFGFWAYENRVWLLNPGVKSSIVDFTRQELGVEDVDVGAWRQGAECLTVEVTTEDDQMYRVILVEENYKDLDYKPLWISDTYTLDDFVPSSDSGCGYFND